MGVIAPLEIMGVQKLEQLRKKLKAFFVFDPVINTMDMPSPLLIIVLLCLLSLCVGAPFSTMDSDSEHIQAYNGFYGNPIYRWKKTQLEIFLRPYGFGSWGVGSVGFGN